MKQRRAFTLIELLVVIAIIAVLMGMLTPVLRSAKDRAKLVACASNQRQLVLGVGLYAEDNDSRLPPSHLEIKGSALLFTWANHINYHSNQPVDSWNNGGAVHHYLGRYLSTVDVFMCPLGPPVDKVKYQALYKTYDDPEVLALYHQGNPDIQTTSSYNMFWGGYRLPGAKFRGPKTLADKSKILVSDVMNYWRDDIWWLAHRSKDVVRPPEQDASISSTTVDAVWWRNAPRYDLPGDILRMNAGYTDGHVESYAPEETVSIDSAGHTFYFPNKWK
jgi:prepilin-type N-terminal cleavage/methylation domain-containing protein